MTKETSDKSSKQHKYLWGIRYDALYRCRLSVLYNRKRERFFDLCDGLTKSAALIFGSAAFAFASAGAPLFGQIASSVVAVTAAFSLVIGYAAKARHHASLAEQFKRIEPDVLLGGERDFTEDQINKWNADIATVESGEPLSLPVVVLICENELHIADKRGKVVELPLWKRFIGQFIYLNYDQGKLPHREVCAI